MISSRRLCNLVIGIADGILENTEMISLQLTYLGAAPMGLILLQPNVTVLEILDLDGRQFQNLTFFCFLMYLFILYLKILLAYLLLLVQALTPISPFQTLICR